jgi:hypothetical protein
VSIVNFSFDFFCFRIKKKNEIRLVDRIERDQINNSTRENYSNATSGRQESDQSEERPLELTPELLAEYSKHQIVNDFLLVGVSRHYVDSKNRYEVSHLKKK